MIRTNAATQALTTAQHHADAAHKPPMQSTSTPPATRVATDQPPPTSTLQRLVADQQDLCDLAAKLRGLDTSIYGLPVTPSKLAYGLQGGVLVPFIGSSIAQKRDTTPSLATAITDLGFEVPGTSDELSALIRKLEQKAALPLLGNLGGALSWPIPTARPDQEKLKKFLQTPNTAVPGLPLRGFDQGTLAYLLSGSTVTQSELQDPVKALQKLLDSPKALVLGQAIQAHFDGVNSDTSVYDYLLAALHVGFSLGSVMPPKRNEVGFFDLGSDSLWGKSSQEVVEGLKSWLISIKRATPGTAPLVAHLMLASKAPQYLIKDIPPSVTVGSIVWSQLAIAAAKIEAQIPGRVASMTYPEVIAAAASLSTDNETVQLAERGALIDWGLANGLLSPSANEPSDFLVDKIRQSYNQQLQQLQSLSSSVYSPIPSRKQIALDHLKTRFPGVDPQVFEAKALRKQFTVEGRTGAGDPRPRSMLDVVMEGEKLGEDMRWTSVDARVPISAFNNFAQSSDIDVSGEFNLQYQEAIDAKKDGHAGMVKYLISKLPLSDRKQFEFGKLEYFYSKDYKTVENKPLEVIKRGNTLYVKTTLKGESNLYEIDTSAGTITKKNDRLPTLLTPLYHKKADGQTEQTFSQLHSYHPFTRSQAPDSEEKPANRLTPKSYDSARTQDIANFYVNALNLDDEALLNHYKGSTSFDHDRSGDKVIKEFLLNLIPFRSAIININKGNYGEATTDLALDLVGLLTMGAGKAAQAVKSLSKGVKALSASTKAANTFKYLGAAAIETLNPISGAGDLLRYLGKGGKSAFNTLRGATGNYDVLKAISHEQGPALIGTYRAATDTVNTVAVLKNDQWYRYDTLRGAIYGAPIQNFKPIGAPTTLLLDGATNNNYGALRANMRSVQTPNNVAAYNKGFSQGVAQNIPGYDADMGPEELRALASKPIWTPEQMGTLTRELRDLEIQHAQYMSALLRHDVQAPGVSVTPVSQIYYLAHVDLASKGECAGLSNLMAMAIHEGKHDQLMRNLQIATRNPLDPDSADFIQELKNFQRAVGTAGTFHMGKTPTKTNAADIIEQLTKAPRSTTLRIGSKDHGMIAGTRVESGRTEWFFYEPNSGMVNFPTPQSMRDGMEKVLESGQIAAYLNPYGSKRGVREYAVSRFDASDLDVGYVYSQSVQGLIDTVL